MKKTVMTAMSFLVALSLCGAEKTLHYSAPITESPPVIDGKILPGEWRDSLSFDGMRHASGGKLEWRSAKSFITSDGTSIYLAMETELPGDGSLVTGKQQNGIQACFEDIAEFFIDPAPDADVGINHHLLVNSAGNSSLEAIPRGNAQKATWKKSDIQFRQSKENGKWTVEAKFPVALFRRELSGSPWGISICRSWMRPLLFSSSPGNFNGNNVRISFAKENPALAFRWNRDPFTKHIDMTLSVRNRSGIPQAYDAGILLTNNHMPDMRKEETLKTAADETANLHFEAKLTGNTCTDFDLRIQLKDSAGREIFPLHYTWNVPLRKNRWMIAKDRVNTADFEIAHYPYSRKLRIENILRSHKGKIPAQNPVEIIEKETGKTVWSGFVPGKDGALTCFTLPELNGIYKVVFQVGGDKVEKELERKRFEWENNTLGLSRKVYPPFTDMTVSGRTVGTVFREHLLGNTGLPEQITVKGVELFASGSRLVANGQPVSGTLSFAEKAPDRVVTASALTGRNFSATASGLWEYDGALKYDLTLNPGKIDSLVLEIPLKDSLAPIAYTGIMRNIVLEHLPSRDGIIWKSTDAPLDKRMPAGFCNYLYLGGFHRGLCVFAENDRNWGWKHGTPNMDIVRRGNAVILRIHLVNAPLSVSRKQTLSFGLMAAPVKPRPKDWAVRWIDNKYTVLGTDVNWLGGPGCCACVYPPGRKTIFWEALAKANVEPLKTPEQKAERKKLADELIRIAAPYFAPFDVPDYQKGYNRLVYHRIARGASYGRNMIFYYNRSVYNGLDEYPTFMNEWTTADFEARRYIPSIDEIFIVPSRSYIDYSLYWHKKSFQYRNHGIYWDNIMCVPSYNTEMTDAYRRPAGSIVPAAGIWQLRSLIKRAFVMMCEEGLPPVTLPHMTSLSFLPMLSFATYQLDWEWKRSAGPVQTRFSRDYCRLVSHGELAGVVPVVCNDAGPQAGLKHIERSFAGVALVHMLDRYNSNSEKYTPEKPLNTLNRAVHERYLHEPGVRTVRYWDETNDSGILIDNKETAWITHFVPEKKAVSVLCSYSDKPQTVRLKFPAGWKTSDFENGRELPGKENNELVLNLKPYEVLAVEFKK